MNRALKNPTALRVVYCLLLACGLLPLWYYILSAFAYPNIPFLMMIAVTAAALFTFFVIVLRGKRLAVVMAGLALVWLAAGVWLRPRLMDGMLTAFQYIIPNLYKIINYDFGPAAIITAADNADCTLFLTWLPIPWAALLCWAVVARRSGLLSLMLTVPLFGFTWALRGTPPGIVLVLLFMFWLTMLVQGRIGGARGPAEALTPILCMALSVGLLSSLIAAQPREDYKIAPKAADLRDDIVNLALDFEYSGPLSGLPGFSTGAPLTRSDGSVNLNATGNIRFAERDVLRVHMDRPGDLFLRGYAAGDYTGHGWLPAEDSPFDEAGIGFDPLMYLEGTGLVSFENSRINPNAVTVEVLDGKTNYMFTPYLLTGPEELAPGAQWVGDAYLSPGDAKEYTFETNVSSSFDPLITGDMEAMYQRGSWFTASTFSRIWDGSELTGDGVILYEDYEIPYVITQWGTVLLASSAVPEDVYTRALEALYSAQDATEHLDIPYPESRQDAAYMDYILEEYTRLPEGLGQAIREWRAGFYQGNEAAPLRAYNIPNVPYHYWLAIAAEVAGQIRDSGDYSTSPGGQPRNRDFVEYFLTESQKGYCVHFASATAVTLRALGIPARYVEGYVVGESSFDAEGWATVPAKSAHAWAEIWLPDIGWMPVESTPGGTAVAQSITSVPAQPENVRPDTPAREERDPAQDEPPSASSEADSTPEEAAEDNPAGSGKDGGPGGGGQSGLWERPAVRAAAYTGLGLAALCVLLLAFRRGMWLYRRRLLRAPQPNRAALNAYAWLARLERHGAAIPESATQIAMKARFSQHQVSPTELAALRAELARQREALRQGAGRWPRLLLWLHIL